MSTTPLAAIFLLMWGSGFIACKAGLYYAEPLTYLWYRFAIAAMLLAVVAWVMRAPWPNSLARYGHLALAGALVHALYLGPNFFAASRGFPVGVTALIGALQPILTAAIASRVLAEQVSPRQWIGLIVGLAGIMMVLSDKLAFDWSQPFELFLVGCGIVSLTVGTLYQKRFCGWMDLRTGTVVQLIVAALIMLVGASSLESFRVVWTVPFFTALSALVLMSVITYSLMHLLFLRGAASRVASMFYLVPPFTSTILYFFFGEDLGWLAVAGIAVTVIGVALATRRR